MFTAKCGFPQGRDEVKDMVQSFIKATKRESPFEDDRPGRDWIILFEKRHKDELNKRDPELLTTTRAKGMTKDNVSKFYDMYEDILKEFDLLDKPWTLFNIDETGLNTDQKNQMVYLGKDVKNAYQLCPPGTKTMYTVLFCISAAGEYLPPYTIYKAKSLWNTWTTGGPKGACYSTSPSGWMFDVNFENWFIHIFIKHTQHLQKPILLTYDGHNSHLTYPTVKAAMDHNIIIVCLPPNTSHALQPLDVGVFRSVKVNWKKILKTWFNETQNKGVCKTVFPRILSRLWLQLNPANAISGFRSTGLCPLNKNAVDSKILISSTNQPTDILHGPRSPRKLLKKAILGVLATPEKPDAEAAIQNKTRKRTRVQTTHGEVLTEEGVLERLKTEAENRNNKKKGKSGVSITIKKTTNSKSTENVSETPGTSSTKAKVQRKLEYFGLKVDKTKAKKRLYHESSESNSEENSEDVKVNITNLQEHISYVIVNYEGSYFPGLVLKIGKNKITVKCMQKMFGTKGWKWPAQDDLHDYPVNEIIQIVETPSVSNNRGTYYVPEIDKYWPI